MRRWMTAALAGTALLGAAEAAGAATISRGSAPLLVLGGTGSGDHVTIAQAGSSIRFTAGPGTTLTNAGAGCTGNAMQVDCAPFVVQGSTPIPTQLIQGDLGGGNDTLIVTGSPVPVLPMVGGAGDDRFELGAGVQQVIGGADSDTVVLLTPSVVNAAGATDVASQVEQFVGSAGDDVFGSVVDQAERFEGGAGTDTLTYAAREAGAPVTVDLDGLADDGGAGEGDDVRADIENLVGGAGNDVLGGSPGTNQLRGGDGVDTASYAGRPDGVTANLDGVANDGAPGENDLLAEFEALVGGEGADFLTGSPGADTLAGGGGNDVLDGADGTDTLLGEAGADQLTGGSGVDAYNGGDGDDAITSFDGLGEDADCGPGSDGATADLADRLVGCESVRRVDEVLDADRDGALPPADCDDNDATRNPGARDVPRNGKDEDCSGADADFGRITSTVQHQWAVTPRQTFATKFTVRDVPPGTRLRLTCDPPGRRTAGCPFKSRTRETVGGARSLNLLPFFKGKRMPVGTSLELRMTRASTVGKVLRFTVRSGKVPKVRTLCLQPGASKPGRC